MIKPIGDEASLLNLGQPVNLGQRMPIDLSQFGRADDQPSFSSLLKQALDHVNSLQQDSSNRMHAIETGASTDLVGAMIAAQKSSLSFQALMQVRNKVVSAYEEVMRMQI
ncbi:flagellar hook-basal body complex protein FliE [Kistimonas asteriae]|uniref:flagellar hook-basal body complex protein FliE n=1 Tax=Kistimonas asteriae TaxID=517724 RepID=UPI001BA4DDB2|nr:flagellar hook-basal body complex protein FliE [Kistimonas asteriae]